MGKVCTDSFVGTKGVKRIQSLRRNRNFLDSGKTILQFICFRLSRKRFLFLL